MYIQMSTACEDVGFVHEGCSDGDWLNVVPELVREYDDGDFVVLYKQTVPLAARLSMLVARLSMLAGPN